MRRLLDAILRFFSSLGLCCVLLILLALLTWLGTLEQVHSGLFEVQKKYFESFFLVHQAGSVPIPLPGANLVMCLLFVNLTVGGIVRLRKGRATAGVLVTHVGILLLLLSGFVKMYFSEDGHMTLFENDRADFFQSYYRVELALIENVDGERGREFLVPQEQFADARGPRPVRLTAPELPFDLEVTNFMPNCRPMPKGPMFEVAVPVVDGVFLQSRPRQAQAEANASGVYATVVDKSEGTRQAGILWSLDAEPWTVTVQDKTWALDLRKERYPLPFTVELEKFTKEDHPGINMPRAFSSDVEVLEGTTSRPVRISMNEPLRDRGYVLYQASWGPSDARPGDRLFSTLSVVRNPADRYPLYACIVIGFGLLLHFARKLIRYVRIESRQP